MSNATTLLAHGKATMVFRGGLGYCAIHLQSVSVSERSYAQFAAALVVRSVKRGKRKTDGVIYTHSDFVILDGWVDLDLPRVYEETKSEDGWTVTTAACALTGDDGKIDAAIKASGATVLRDFRKHDARATKAA